MPSADGTAVAGGGVVREPAGVLNCPVGSGVAITPDLLAYWPRQKPVTVDVVISNCIGLARTPAQHLAQAAAGKERGTGYPENLPVARAMHRDALAALAVARAARPRQPATVAAAVAAETAARDHLTNAYRPGQAEAARQATVSFHPLNMSAMGGHGRGARAAVAAIAHPGDGLSLGETGERFEAADVVYNTRLHRQYLVLSMAVAFWNASYSGADDVAAGRPPIPWGAGAAAAATAAAVASS